MNKQILMVVFLLSSLLSFSQYNILHQQRLIRQADSLYNAANYLASAQVYSNALRNHTSSTGTQYYNAACSWALAGNKDSAFHYLFIAVHGKGYANVKHISEDKDLKGLHSDKRWKKLIQTVSKNKKAEAKKHNRKLEKELTAIYNDDQRYRNQIDSVLQHFGMKSSQWTDLNAKITAIDSVNEIKVSKILDRYGWLGPNSKDGQKIEAIHSYYMYLIIQHSKLETQIKYLPLLKEAIQKGNARPKDYAYVQDRILMRQGLRQLYGTQLSFNPETKKQFIWPIEDIENLDKRRKEIGMEPMAAYAKTYFNINDWSIESYKSELPSIESFLRKGNGIKY